jgi:molybdenum cofactor cytidylyltransferase
LIAAVILAAGAATRMGRVKQLLSYRGTTFLQHAIDQAVDAGLSPIVVVVGSHAGLVTGFIGSPRVNVVYNEAWQTGMGSSIAAGIRHLHGFDVAGAAILVADQPLVTAQHLRAMAALMQSSKMVAAEFDGTLGVPAFFRREVFPLLESLPPEAGARHLLRNSGEVTAYPLPEAAIDVDTPQDLSSLLQS